MRLGHYVQVADMAETDRLWNTLCRWWLTIEVCSSPASPTPRPKPRTPASQTLIEPPAASATNAGPCHSYECCSKRSMNTQHRKSTFTRNREEPDIHAVQRRPHPQDAIDPTATTSWTTTAGPPPALVRPSPRPRCDFLFVARPAQVGPCR